MSGLERCFRRSTVPELRNPPPRSKQRGASVLAPAPEDIEEPARPVSPLNPRPNVGFHRPPIERGWVCRRSSNSTRRSILAAGVLFFAILGPFCAKLFYFGSQGLFVTAARPRTRRYGFCEMGHGILEEDFISHTHPVPGSSDCEGSVSLFIPKIDSPKAEIGHVVGRSRYQESRSTGCRTWR